MGGDENRRIPALTSWEQMESLSGWCDHSRNEVSRMAGNPNCPHCGKLMNRTHFGPNYNIVDPETGERTQKPSHYHCHHCGYEEEPPETVEGSEA